MIRIYYARIKGPLPEPQYLRYLSRLPEALQEKNRRFIHWKDKLLHITGKLLLMHAWQQSGWGNGCLHDLRYNEYDRPFIHGQVDFNISHSGDYVLCAIGEQVQLGVDIEEIKAVDFSDFEHVMTTGQWERIKNAPDPKKAFFSYWSIKESVIKADSRGMSLPLNDIVIEDNVAHCDGRTWFLNRLMINDKYCACLAASKPCDHIVIQQEFSTL